MIGIVIYVLVAFILSVILVNVNDALDNKEEEITKMLPGYNCGACGYKGCSHLAHNIVNDSKLYNKCKLLNGDNLKKMQDYIDNME